MLSTVRRSSVLVVVGALALVGAVRAEDDSFKKDLAKLLDRYDDSPDKLQKGVDLCKKRIEAKPDDHEARLQLVRFLIAKDDYAQALGEAEKAEQSAKEPNQKDEAKVLVILALNSKMQKLLEGIDQQKVQQIAQGEIEKLENAKTIGELGKAPKPIDKKDMEGKDLKLDDYKGKVLLIDFWATWCGPCVHEMPNVIATYEKYHARGFEVLGISLDEDKGAVESFTKDKKMTWRQYFDGKGWQNELAQAWGVRSIPKTYLLDHTGKVRFVSVRGEALEAAVKELVERAEAAKK